MPAVSPCSGAKALLHPMCLVKDHVLKGLEPSGHEKLAKIWKRIASKHCSALLLLTTGSMGKGDAAEERHKWPGSIDAACKRHFRFTQDLDVSHPSKQVESFHQAEQKCTP